MKKQRNIILCSLCGNKIIESDDITISPKELGDQNHIPQIEMRRLIDTMFEKHTGYICETCTDILFSDNTLRKVTKRAMPFSNSSHIILPKTWEGRKILAFALSLPCEICGNPDSTESSGRFYCVDCMGK